ncbi:MAG TPA: glycosyltransferase [Acidimicrobiales bacterium]|nr:glycosyltransferase [Acidimicrobiales bacterium]
MTDPVASVVIAAHNERAVIGRCLQSLQADGLPLEVVVVCNGCADDTARVARAVGGATVVQLRAAGKAAALNAGDGATSVFPRVYLDADVVLEPGGMAELLAALDARVLAASPRVVVDDRHSSWIVRSYYRIWLRLGSVAGGLAGSGAYAISCEGRARFGRFPDIVADDLFVEQRFGREERVVVDAAAVAYAAPADVRELFARKVRVFAGNLQLEQALAVAPAPDSAPGGDRWWRVVLRAPRMVKDVPVYVAITAVAKLHARRLARRGRPIAWRSPVRHDRPDTTPTPMPRAR